MLQAQEHYVKMLATQQHERSCLDIIGLLTFCFCREKLLGTFSKSLEAEQAISVKQDETLSVHCKSILSFSIKTMKHLQAATVESSETVRTTLQHF